MRGGDALYPTSAATTVRVQDGQAQVSDGPFAEAREQLGGYYVIEWRRSTRRSRRRGASSVDSGSVQVRPIVEFD